MVRERDLTFRFAALYTLAYAFMWLITRLTDQHAFTALENWLPEVVAGARGLAWLTAVYCTARMVLDRCNTR